MINQKKMSGRIALMDLVEYEAVRKGMKFDGTYCVSYNLFSKDGENWIDWEVEKIDDKS